MKKILRIKQRAKLLLLLILSVLSVESISAQCSNPYQYGSATVSTVNGTTVTITTCQYLSEYSVIYGMLSSTVYTAAIASTSGYVTIRQGSATGPAVAFGPSPLTFTPPANGTYYAHWTVNASCATASGCQVTTIQTVGPSNNCQNPAAGGTTAANPALACVGQPVSFSLSGATTGTGTTYQWQNSTNGGSTWTNIAGATNSTYSGNQATTTSYQCIVTCASGTPATSTPVSVAMNTFFNCYCQSSASSSGDTDLHGVQVGTLNNPSGCGSLGGPGSIANQYENYTALPAPILVQGFPVASSVSPGTCGGNYNSMTKVFIDYDQDGTFADPAEVAYVTSTPVAGPHTEYFNIVVPMTALVGITGMRVVTRETTSASLVSPCGSYTWGGTEDYLVNIQAPLVDDAGISEFVSPLLPTCNFGDSVRVAIKNNGTDTLTSATINWAFNGTPQTPVSWTGSLPTFGTDTVTLGLVALASGSSLVAFTVLPNGVVENSAGAYNDTSTIANLLSGLNGSYTIGGVTPDFTDFAAAIAELDTYGTCGPVVFDVRDGVYTEQITLNDVSSMDAVNTVTFRSENGDASLVTLTQAGSGTADNFVINMNGGDYYIIENMTLENTGTTYSRVLNFGAGCDSNRFEGCNMLAVNAGSTSTFAAMIYSAGTNDNGNHFINNTIQGGSYGMYWYGGGTTSAEEGTVIEGNHFKDNYYYGMRLYYQDGIIVKDNTIDGVAAYNFRYAIYGSYLNKGPQIIGNNIHGTGTSGFVYGIYWFNGGGTPAITGLVENNMVSVGYPGSTSSCYGLYMSNIGYMDVNHNTLLVSAGGTASRAYYPASGGGNNVKNNIFANYTGGYAIYLGNAFAVAQCDHNVLYSPAGNIGYYNGIQQTMADWQNASAFDANSIDNNPMFFSSQDLHVCNDTIGNQGTPIASITMDIDGQMRSATTPDMGADEFSGLTGSFLGPDALVCAGDSIMISAGSPTDTILWSTGDTTAFIWVTTPGTYTVSINSACGSGTDAIVVNQSALNYSNYVVANDLVFCEGDSVLLYGSQMADTYQWSGGSTATTDSVYATTGGAYTLAITDACGTGSETVNLTMNTAPTAGFTSTSSYLTGVFSNTSSSAGTTTYLWDFGDGSTSTQADPNHVYGSTGVYTVTLTVTNDCGTNVFTNTITLSVAGLEEVADFGTINVYPNPSTGEFQLEMDVNYAMNLDIVVTNALGQKLLVRSLNTTNGVHTETIDLSTEAVGVYYLNISSEGNTLTNRMIIKK